MSTKVDLNDYLGSWVHLDFLEEVPKIQGYLGKDGEGFFLHAGGDQCFRLTRDFKIGTVFGVRRKVEYVRKFSGSGFTELQDNKIWITLDVDDLSEVLC